MGAWLEETPCDDNICPVARFLFPLERCCERCSRTPAQETISQKNRSHSDRFSADGVSFTQGSCKGNDWSRTLDQSLSGTSIFYSKMNRKNTCQRVGSNDSLEPGGSAANVTVSAAGNLPPPARACLSFWELFPEINAWCWWKGNWIRPSDIFQRFNR